MIFCQQYYHYVVKLPNYLTHLAMAFFSFLKCIEHTQQEIDHKRLPGGSDIHVPSGDGRVMALTNQARRRSAGRARVVPLCTSACTSAGACVVDGRAQVRQADGVVHN